MTYALLLAVVLVLMNTYPLVVSQDLVFRSKATSLQSSVSVMVYSLSGLDRLNAENVTAAMAVVEENAKRVFENNKNTVCDMQSKVVDGISEIYQSFL